VEPKGRSALVHSHHECVDKAEEGLQPSLIQTLQSAWRVTHPLYRGRNYLSFTLNRMLLKWRANLDLQNVVACTSNIRCTRIFIGSIAAGLQKTCSKMLSTHQGTISNLFVVEAHAVDACKCLPAQLEVQSTTQQYCTCEEDGRLYLQLL
jgi:hypothetical protein